MKKGLFVVIVLALFAVMIAPAFAEVEVSLGTDETAMAEKCTIEEGVTHEEFANVLVKDLDAEGLLPPAATTNDIFKLWETLGLVPPGGWKADSVITIDDLKVMLGEPAPEDADFCQVYSLLKKKLINIVLRVKGSEVAPVISPLVPAL